MARRRYTSRSIPKLTDPEEGAAAVRKFAIGLFDREDGRAANWPLIADALLRSAFGALDEMPAGAARDALLRRTHDAAYSRLTQQDAGVVSDGCVAGGPPPEDRTPSLRRDFRP